MNTILGLGYVGLTMALSMAERNLKTFGVDEDRKKMGLISSGRSPIFEPMVEELISKEIKAGMFVITDNIQDAMENSSITFVTVGTPSLPDGSIDVEPIKKATESIGKTLRKIVQYHLIVIRSTVIPGTTEKVIMPTLETKSGKKCGKDFGLCVNPEFLSEGSALEDMRKPSRIVIGEYDEKSGNMLETFYRRFYLKDLPRLIRTSLTNAELIKYANNSFLATKISFINSIANLCEKISNADVEIVAEALALDPRIGTLFLNAGLGWGGSCFPKDLRAITKFARSKRMNLPIIEAAMRVNELQPISAVTKARRALGELKGKRIAILGLAFKPRTDDIREAVSIKIITKLIKEGAKITAYDPIAMDNAQKIFGKKISLAESARKCIAQADCAILVTEWDEFKNLNPEDFKAEMNKPILVDGRRIYDAKEFSKKLDYYAIGLKKT
jgi:UDPglucose 6-dehydrogenase